MSVQVPLFDETDSTSSQLALRLDARLDSDVSIRRFGEHFETLVEASGGISALRQLVRDLAVRGLLAPQCDDDVPARLLVESILRSPAAMETRRRFVDADAESGTVSREHFQLPPHWRWTRLSDLVVKLGAGSTPTGGKAVYRTSGVKFLRSQNVWNDGIRLEDVAFIDPSTHERMAGTHVSPGDILLNITGASIGRTAIVPVGFDEGNVSQHVAIVRLADKDLGRFVHLAMLSTYFQDFIMEVQVGVSREGLSMKKLQGFLVPIPPLAEQKRIVAKVDQLMALCDEIEARQTKKRETGTRLTKAALDALAMADGAEEFDDAWKRVVANFDVIVSNPASVASVRETILSLASTGRLVRGTTAARPEVASGGDSYEPSFAIPANWSWSPLGRLCRFIDYRGRTPIKTSSGVRLITAKNVRMGVLRNEPAEYIAEAAYEGWMTRGFPKVGDVLFTTEAPLGNVAQLTTTERVALAQRIIVLQPTAAMDPAFLKTVLMAPPMQRTIRARATGTTALGIKSARLKLVPCPVPPLAEQAEIVRRVEALMKTCDELELHLARMEDRGAKLAESVVEELLARERARL